MSIPEGLSFINQNQTGIGRKCCTMIKHRNATGEPNIVQSMLFKDNNSYKLIVSCIESIKSNYWQFREFIMMEYTLGCSVSPALSLVRQ